jgi:hypothetical protein
MKKIILNIFFAIFLCSPVFVSSQSLNWGRSINGHTQFLNIYAGAEHGFIFGAGYGYQLKSKIPIVLNVSYSFPSGEDLFDDFKIKAGGVIRLYQTGNIHFSAIVDGVLRRYQNELVRLVNFGSDISAIAGYYKSTWFVAAEARFDKAIVTHFKHTDSYREIFPMVKDGWYEPPSGGNFYYGLQAGISRRRADIYLKASKVVTEDFQTTPVIAFAVQLGFNLRIGRQSRD